MNLPSHLKKIAICLKKCFWTREQKQNNTHNHNSESLHALCASSLRALGQWKLQYFVLLVFCALLLYHISSRFYAVSFGESPKLFLTIIVIKYYFYHRLKIWCRPKVSISILHSPPCFMQQNINCNFNFLS